MLNCTPHSIHVFSKEDVEYVPQHRKLFIKSGATPKVIIPPSGTVLSLQLQNELEGEREGIPIYKKRMLSYDQPIDGAIVSALYGAHVAPRHPNMTLYGVADPVYESVENPRPVGCLGLQVF